MNNCVLDSMFDTWTTGNDDNFNITFRINKKKKVLSFTNFKKPYIIYKSKIIKIFQY